MSDESKALRAWLVGCAAVVAACAEAPAKPDRYPVSETLCQYVGLESIETPQHTPQSDRDSLSLLAVYRFREANVPAPKEPLTVKFQVNRARVSELRSHLEAQPEVICTPDRDAHYHVRVKPFAQPQPDPQAGETPMPTQAELPAPGLATPRGPTATPAASPRPTQ